MSSFSVRTAKQTRQALHNLTTLTSLNNTGRAQASDRVVHVLRVFVPDTT